MDLSHLDDDHVVLVKLNPAIHLAKDAELAISCARAAAQDGNKKNEISFSRMSIMMHFMAFEGALNFTFTYSEVPRNKWKNYSIGQKWENVSQDCLPLHGIIELEDGNVVYRPSQPIPQTVSDQNLHNDFLEFKRLRNLLAHLKPEFFAAYAAEADNSPSRIQNFGLQTAEETRDIYLRLIQRIKTCMMGVMDDPLESERMAEYRTDG